MTPHQSKIEHFVVLYMENRPFDHIFGCMLQNEGLMPGADGVTHGQPIAVDPDDPSKGYVNITCGTAEMVCKGGASYSLFAPKFKPGAGNVATFPYDPQSARYDYARGAHGEAIAMFSGDQLPVKRAVAEHFGIFNHLYTAVPSASYPNHQFTQSATSCGVVDNVVDWSQCGGNQTLFPQKTIYDALTENGNSFGIYYNTTPSSADLFMEGVARHKDRILPSSDFYAAAATGDLPHFSWVMPGRDPRNGGANSDHPCNDVALGERLLKDVYESLRAGPGWEKTLLFVVYDDAGFFYDHTVPPVGVPSDDAECHRQAAPGGCPTAFDFRRLGLRAAAMLISPWIAPKTLIGEPRGPTLTSQWELTSVPATIKNLFNLTSFLTKRDAWAGSFDELLTLPSPRMDAPLHLPEAPEPATGHNHHSCGAPTEPTRRQRRDVRLLSHLNGVDHTVGDEELPDALGHDSTALWIRQQWEAFLSRPLHPPEAHDWREPEPPDTRPSTEAANNVVSGAEDGGGGGSDDDDDADKAGRVDGGGGGDDDDVAEAKRADNDDDDSELVVINGVAVRHDKVSHPFPIPYDATFCPADVFARLR